MKRYAFLQLVATCSERLAAAREDASVP